MGAISETLKIFLHLRSDFTKTSVVTSVTRNMIRASSDSNIIREGLKIHEGWGGGIENMGNFIFNPSSCNI